MTAPRYDGIQTTLFEGDPTIHCYTITDPASPAVGCSFTIEGDAPTADTIAAAVTAKEAQFNSDAP